MEVLELIKGGKREDEGLIGVIAETLRSSDWKFRREPDASVIRTGARGDNSDFNIIFVVKEDRGLVAVYIEYSPLVPEGKRKEAADFVARANFGLYVGNFELNMLDGSVRYKVSIDIEGGELTQTMVNNMVNGGLYMADRYFPALMSVCFGNTIPAVAIRKVEN